MRRLVLCAVALLASACGAASEPERQPGPEVRHGAVILGCGDYCRATPVEDALRDTPEVDVAPPYAAQWKVSHRWKPFSDGIAPITVTCNAGLACDGALFLTIYSPTRVITAPQRLIGRSDLHVAPHRTRTIGVPLSASGLRRVRAVLEECRRYRASSGSFPPDPSVGLTVDARQSRERLPRRHRRFLTWVYFTGIVCV